MAYNYEYPYTDVNYNNDDWIINTIKQLLSEWKVTEDNWKETKDYITDYFKNLDVSEEIADKLDNMAEDGSLANIINEQIFNELNSRVEKNESDISNLLSEVDDKLEENQTLIDTKLEENQTLIKDRLKETDNRFVGFNSANNTWNIIKVDEQLIMSDTKTISSTRDTNYTSISASVLTRMTLDMPIADNDWAISSTGGGDFVSIGNTSLINNGTEISFRLYTPLPSTAVTFSSRTIRFLMTGMRRKPRINALNSWNATKAKQIIDVANTYLQAIEDGRKFAYGYNWLYENGTKEGQSVNNEKGEGLSECDTFVFLCLMGIPYTSSPYALVTAPNGVYDKQNIEPNTNYTWTMRDWKKGTDRGFIDNTGDENWYFWMKDWIFNPRNADGSVDWTQVRDGDVIILRAPDRRFFDNIGHIGIVVKKEGTEGHTIEDWDIIHCSGRTETNENVIGRFPMTRYLDVRKLYKTKDIYFARIAY